MSHGHDDHKHAHPPYLAHHFDTPAQQFENGKLGMWIFLGTEVLMFGGLFALYALYRANHTDIYVYAHKMLNPTLGAINTAILLASSWTMVMGVRAATLGQKKALVAWLVLTFMGGVGFFCVKSKEYGAKFDHGLYPGRSNLYYPLDSTTAEVRIKDETSGKVFEGSLSPANDKYWVDAFGGDKNGRHRAQLAAIAHVEHEMNLVGHGEHHAAHGLEPKAEAAEAPEAAAPAPVTGAPEGFGSKAQQHVVTQPQGTHAAQVADGADKAPSIAQQLGTPDIRTRHHELAYSELPFEEQKRVHIFFQIYYVMTGLHGLHVAIGMAILLWLIIKAAKGHFSAEYNAPVDIGGLYWHLVDLIWIFLFPLLYLIH